MIPRSFTGQRSHGNDLAKLVIVAGLYGDLSKETQANREFQVNLDV